VFSSEWVLIWWEYIARYIVLILISVSCITELCFLLNIKALFYI